MPITKTFALLVTITAVALVGHAVSVETANFREADKPVSAETKPASSGPVVVPDDKMQSLRGGDTFTAEAAEERGGFITRFVNAVKGSLESLRFRATHPDLKKLEEGLLVTDRTSPQNLEMLDEAIPATDIISTEELKMLSDVLHPGDANIEILTKRNQAVMQYFQTVLYHGDLKTIRRNLKEKFHMTDHVADYYMAFFSHRGNDKNMRLRKTSGN